MNTLIFIIICIAQLAINILLALMFRKFYNLHKSNDKIIDETLEELQSCRFDLEQCKK